MLKKSVNTFLILLCGLATASHAQSANSTAANQETDKFLTINKGAANLIRVNPATDWTRYRTYRLVPAVWEPAVAAWALHPGEVVKLEAVVDRSLQRTFTKPSAGDGAVLEVRTVITSFKRTNTLLNVIGFASIQAPISYGGASVRYELFDGQSGEEIGEISCKRNARPWNVYPWHVLDNFEALGQGSVILKSDSRKLRKDLERLGKLTVKPGQEAMKGAE